MKDSAVLQLPVSTIAYIGDAVYSLHCRIKYLDLLRVDRIHKKVNQIVSRSGQAKSLDRLMSILNETELSLVKRAVNSKAAKKHGNDPLYRKSTAFEALLGFLYLSQNYDRLMKLIEITLENGENDSLR
ncbi:MAG TPA: ribonuclease III domain-containing protein [Pseudothermotoga sp.]